MQQLRQRTTTRNNPSKNRIKSNQDDKMQHGKTRTEQKEGKGKDSDTEGGTTPGSCGEDGGGTTSANRRGADGDD